MSKRQTNKEQVTKKLLLLVNLNSTPAEQLPEAIRKAILAAYHAGYSDGVQESLSEGISPNVRR